MEAELEVKRQEAEKREEERKKRDEEADVVTAGTLKGFLYAVPLSIVIFGFAMFMGWVE